MRDGKAILVLGGLGALGVLALAASPGGRAVARRVEAVIERWTDKVIRYVSAREGRPDSLNRNLDGAGLSFGVIQWTQHSGSLGALLSGMQEADPEAFARLFGPSWSKVLDVTRRASLEPIDGANLWDEPWASRFQAAGRHEPFVDVQWAMAARGPHFRAAEDVAAILGVRTERAMTLFFDRAVHQGADGARTMATRLRDWYASKGRPSVPYKELLEAYAWMASNKFRRTTAPGSPAYSAQSPHIAWMQVGAEWHAFAGQFDLYAIIVRRTGEILRDPALSDEPIAQAVA